MKKKALQLLSVCLLIVLIAAIWVNSGSYIENHDWKYVEGAHIGDWLPKHSFKVDDGILETKSAQARVIFSIGTKLIIEDVVTKERGIYVNKR